MKTTSRCAWPVARCAVPALIAAMPMLAPAQEIAERVRRVGDGTLRMTYATRAGVCGDGGDVVGFGRALFIWPSIESHGRWNAPRCQPGAARVAVTVAGGRPVALRTFVGGNWSSGSATDAGTIPARDAAAYFLSIAGDGEGRLSRDAILPAVIADSADVAPTLLRIARDRQRPTETRSRALHWVGQLGGATSAEPLVTIARDGSERHGVREAALFALSAVPDDGGISSLMRIADDAGDPWLRSKAVFWLGETEDARAMQLLQRLVLQEDADVDLRKAALFATGRGQTPIADLVSLYGRLRGQELREHYIFVLSQREEDAAIDKLMDIARNDPDREMRKKALFWLGQSDDPRAAKLIRDLVLN